MNIRISKRKVVMYRIVFALFAISALIMVFNIRSSAENKNPTYKYYTSFKVEDGDTVWSIAKEYYTVDYKDMNEYIYEIKSMNHLSDELTIHEGAYLTIPYYDIAVK